MGASAGTVYGGAGELREILRRRAWREGSVADAGVAGKWRQGGIAGIPDVPGQVGPGHFWMMEVARRSPVWGEAGENLTNAEPYRWERRRFGRTSRHAADEASQGQGREGPRWPPRSDCACVGSRSGVDEMRLRRLAYMALTAAAVSLPWGGAASAAATGEWTRTTGSTWWDSGNWLDLLVPHAADDEAVFLDTIESAATVTVDAPVTLGTLYIGNMAPLTFA